MNTVEKQNLVPVYCCIPETWELPEAIHYEEYSQFIKDCNELFKENKLKAGLGTELLWRDKSVAETWVDNFNSCELNKRSKVGTFWISSNSAANNMVQTAIVLLRTVHPMGECPLPEGELELVAVSNWIGLHKLISIPFFLDLETYFKDFGAIAIPLEKFHQNYRIQKNGGTTAS